MTAKTLAFLIATSLLLLAGCGNKGPLMLPPAPAADEATRFDETPPVPEADATRSGVDAESGTGDDGPESDALPDPPPAVR